VGFTSQGISSKVEDVHPEKRTKLRCSNKKYCFYGTSKKSIKFPEIFLSDAGTTDSLTDY
jgi:hypothetical protein